MAKVQDPMDAILKNIEKAMGNNKGKSPFSRFANVERVEVPVISFGIKAIDDASYIGGVPRGKVIEIFGPESSGKSLLSYRLIAEAQKSGLECALIDIEQSFDPIWAASHGIDVKKLVYSNDFTCGEQALEYTNLLCKSKMFGLVVVDSTAALVPLAEIEGTLTDKTRPGVQAAMMSRACRKIINSVGVGNTTCVFINQIRMKIGVMYGNPETTSGGQALKFYSHQRIEVRKKSQIKVKDGINEVVVGQISSVKFVKNKTARPFGQCEFKVIFDATSLNPVVMLANSLKTTKLIKVYKGVYNIPPDTIDNKDKIETGATTMPELANFIIKNNLVISLVDALIDNATDVSEIDGAILEMKEDPTKIVSPTDNATLEAEKVDDATPTEEELAESKLDVRDVDAEE